MHKLDRAFGFDVDQTLNTNLVALHLKHYNSILNLGLSSQYIQEANKNYRKVFDVPEIAAAMNNRENEFKAARKWIRESHEVNMAFDVMPGSVLGVKHLSLIAHSLGYFTVRPQIEGMYEMTRDWLAMAGIPNSQKTIVCKDPGDKIDKIVRSTETDLPVVLIDDSLGGPDGLLAAAAKYSPQDLLNRLTLVGFGMNTTEAQSLREEMRVSSTINVLGLASWNPNLVHALTIELAV